MKRWSLAIGLAVWVLAMAATVTAQPAPLQSDVYGLRHDSDGFYLSRYRFMDEEKVDVGGLSIDDSRLSETNFPLYWQFRPDARAYLLQEGYIRDPNAAPPLVAARPARVLVSPAPVPLDPPRPSFLARVGDWLKGVGDFFVRHLSIVVAVLSLPFLGWAAQFLWKSYARWRSNRAIEMIYCGLPATGKTSLIARFRHPDLPPEHFDVDRTTRKIIEKLHDPIVRSGLTFRPMAIDIPGSKPETFLERILAPKKIQGRRVLLVVLAPFGRTEGQSDADMAFMMRQTGYVFGLIGAVISSPRLPKPDLVVVFMNKIDQFSGDARTFEEAFKADLDRVTSLCKARGVRCLKFKGSARTGHGVNGVIGSIVEHLGG